MISPCGGKPGGVLALIALILPIPAAAQTSDSVLSRPVTVEFRGVSLAEALIRLRTEHAVPVAWSGDLLPDHHPVSLSARDEPLRSALRTLLQGTGLGFALTRQGTVVIVRRDAATAGREDGAADSAQAERLRFATGVRRLDRIIVLGTAVAGAPLREQPGSVSLIDRQQLERAAAPRLEDLLRGFLPGIVLWDRGPAGPPPQFAAIRGISSFTSRGLKTYVDQVELASPELLTLVDGRAIERVEVLRGPQGAALYGPDALNGIMQIVTRKGRYASAVAARGSAAAGQFARPDLPSGSLWQDYSLGFDGGRSRSSVELHGAFARTGSAGDVPWLNRWTAHAAGRSLLGPVVMTASARAGRHEYGAERMTTDASPPAGSVPLAMSEQALSLTLVHAPGGRWRQTLIAGYHRASGERELQSSVLLTPRLPLAATHETARRTSLRYGSAVDLPLGTHELGLAAGAEHARRFIERSDRRALASPDLVRLYDDDLHSTGFFGQGRLRLGSRLILSGGTRAEWSSSVGPEAGPEWASSAGVAWTQPLGRSMLRLRTAWGRGIRPPEPGMSRAMAVSGLRQEANPALEPESQRGWEAGVELHLDERVVLRSTWYDQTADDLIQQVPLRRDGVERVYQFQNLGSINNRGVELEGAWRAGRLTGTAALFLNRSRVERLAPHYTGEFQTGDEPPEVPDAVGAFRLRYDHGALGMEVGGWWLGSWTGYDWAAVLSAQPARASDREYWIEYPGGFRPWMAVSWRIRDGWQVHGRVDNPGNTTGTSRTNVTPPAGRVALIGIRLEP